MAEDKRIIELPTAGEIPSNAYFGIDSTVNPEDSNTGSRKIRVTTLLEKTVKVMLTQAEYDDLPSDKLTDGKVYYVTDESKIIINGTVYGAGGETVSDVYVNGTSVVDANAIAQIKSYKEVTQAEYDALPDSKYTDGVMYCIKDSEFSAENVPYDNTDSGLEADNVQDAIDEEVDALGDEVTLREELESATKVYGTPKNLPQAIATFSDGANLPMPSLKTTIVPIQSGSGDPSPSNVRPISGWSGANVSVCGKNLFIEDFDRYNKPDNYWVVPIKMPVGTSFTFKATKTGNAVSGIIVGYVRDGDRYSNFVGQSNVIDSSGNVYTRTFTADNTYKNPKLIFYGNATTFAEVLANYEIQLELGSTATTYEPYNGNTYTIPFTDSQGNPIEVYGGEVDCVNGGNGNVSAKGYMEITKDTPIDYVRVASNGIATFYFHVSNIDSSNANSNCESNALASYESTSFYNYPSPFSVAFSNHSSAETTKSVCISTDSNITTETDFKTWIEQIGTIQVLYRYATPSTFTSQPTSIKSLEGVNNVWGDCGSIKDLKYTRNLNITINDLISRVEDLEG